MPREARGDEPEDGLGSLGVDCGANRGGVEWGSAGGRRVESLEAMTVKKGEGYRSE